MKKKYYKTIEIPLDQLALLCLSVDYKIKDLCQDAVEDLSFELQKKHKFNTHEFRLALDKLGMDGAI